MDTAPYTSPSLEQLDISQLARGILSDISKETGHPVLEWGCIGDRFKDFGKHSGTLQQSSNDTSFVIHCMYTPGAYFAEVAGVNQHTRPINWDNGDVWEQNVGVTFEPTLEYRRGEAPAGHEDNDKNTGYFHPNLSITYAEVFGPLFDLWVAKQLPEILEKTDLGRLAINKQLKLDNIIVVDQRVDSSESHTTHAIVPRDQFLSLFEKANKGFWKEGADRYYCDLQTPYSYLSIGQQPRSTLPVFYFGGHRCGEKFTDYEALQAIGLITPGRLGPTLERTKHYQHLCNQFETAALKAIGNHFQPLKLLESFGNELTAQRLTEQRRMNREASGGMPRLR